MNGKIFNPMDNKHAQGRPIDDGPDLAMFMFFESVDHTAPRNWDRELNLGSSVFEWWFHDQSADWPMGSLSTKG